MLAEQQIDDILFDFSKLPSMEIFYYSTMCLMEHRKYKIHNTNLFLIIRMNYNNFYKKFFYTIKFEDHLGKYISIDDAFEKLPIDIKDWAIFNLDIIK